MVAPGVTAVRRPSLNASESGLVPPAGGWIPNQS